MKCPKCGYISFDFYDACPKCNRDLREVRDKLILFPFKASPINWLEAEEEEISAPGPDIATGEIAPEEAPAQGEEIELETISLDSLDIGAEKEEEKEKEPEKEIGQEQQEIVLEAEEEEGIEIEPVDLKVLEEQMEKKEKEKGKEEIKEEAEEKEVELEPIDLESLEIELEEEKDKEK